MKKIIWEVEAISLPKAVRYCKRCHKKTEYASSGLFRINAQQRYLDIWLIYKCSKCDSTWKMTVYSRINPDSISAKLLERFYSNDCELAAQYAADTALLNKNGAEVKMPEYSITGEAVDLNTPAKLLIKSKYPAKLKASKILRKKLNISNREFNQMVACGVIKSDCDLRKCKLHKEIELLIG